MNILPGALPITHAPDPVMAGRADNTPVPQVTASQSLPQMRNQSGNQQSREKTFADREKLRAILAPPPDPDQPTGPPPAFEANLLETERERLRNGVAAAPAPEKPDVPGVTAKEGYSTRSVTGPPSTPDSAPPAPAQGSIDIKI